MNAWIRWAVFSFCGTLSANSRTGLKGCSYRLFLVFCSSWFFNEYRRFPILKDSYITSIHSLPVLVKHRPSGHLICCLSRANRTKSGTGGIFIRLRGNNGWTFPRLQGVVGYGTHCKNMASEYRYVTWKFNSRSPYGHLKKLGLRRSFNFFKTSCRIKVVYVPVRKTHPGYGVETVTER